MKIAFLFIINLIFLYPSIGQEKKGKDLSFRMGIDPLKLISPASSVILLGNDTGNVFYFSRFELSAGVTYKKMITLALDGGFSQLNEKVYYRTFDYNAKGFYVKPGFDFNINYTEKIQNFWGMRVGITKFRETSAVHVHGNYWKDDYFYTINQNIFSTWIELVGGLRINVKRLGFAASTRLRLLTKLRKTSTELETRHIPGYGRPNAQSAALNFEISYRLTK